MADVKARTAREWAAIETPEYVRAIVEDVQRRQAAGDRRAPQHVALDALEEVWVRSGHRRLANLAYRRTLAIGRRRPVLAVQHQDVDRSVSLPLPRAPESDISTPRSTLA